MRLLAISDTHGKADLNAILHVAETCDLLVHLGDGFQDGQILQAALRTPIVQVSGNADYPFAMMPEKMIELGGRQIYLTHGHLYDVKKGLDNLLVRAAEVEADLVLFGHLHRRVSQVVGKTRYFNPASAWRNYDGSEPCVGVVDLATDPPSCTWIDVPAARPGKDTLGR
ncbi:MAG: YfcE family phosphodiesterase [Candidatus Sericytochromatia bacterium]|nr:YfcE family phosphodiesterase [Candidatus Tanganyikabacteria bacterium]